MQSTSSASQSILARVSGSASLEDPHSNPPKLHGHEPSPGVCKADKCDALFTIKRGARIDYAWTCDEVITYDCKCDCCPSSTTDTPWYCAETNGYPKRRLAQRAKQNHLVDDAIVVRDEETYPPFAVALQSLSNMRDAAANIPGSPESDRKLRRPIGTNKASEEAIAQLRGMLKRQEKLTKKEQLRRQMEQDISSTTGMLRAMHARLRDVNEDYFFGRGNIELEQSVKIYQDEIHTNRACLSLENIRRDIDKQTFIAMLSALVPNNHAKVAFERAFPPAESTTVPQILLAHDNDKEKVYIGKLVPTKKGENEVIHAVECSGDAGCDTKVYHSRPLDEKLARTLHPRALNVRTILPLKSDAGHMAKNDGNETAVHMDTEKPVVWGDAVATKLIEWIRSIHPRHSAKVLSEALGKYKGRTLFTVTIGNDGSGATITLYYRTVRGVTARNGRRLWGHGHRPHGHSPHYHTPHFHTPCEKTFVYCNPEKIRRYDVEGPLFPSLGQSGVQKSVLSSQTRNHLTTLSVCLIRLVSPVT